MSQDFLCDFNKSGFMIHHVEVLFPYRQIDNYKKIRKNKKNKDSYVIEFHEKKKKIITNCPISIDINSRINTCMSIK
jgi:hypothetical protein